jgi:hypothetical protein
VRRFIVLPFVNRQVEQFGQRLKSLVEKNYMQVQFSTIFRAPVEIGKRFPFKDNIKKVESKSLQHKMYSIKCRDCNAEYIGKTERILSHRLKEHRNSKTSACKQHEETTGHSMDYGLSEERLSIKA